MRADEKDGFVRRAIDLVDRLFLLSASELGVEELRRRRLLAICGLPVVFSAFFFCFQLLALNGWRLRGDAAILLAGGPVGAVTLLLLRSRRLSGLAAPLFCFELLIVLTAVPASASGFWDSSLWWFAVVPIASAGLVGPRFALVCSLYAAAALLAFYVMAPAAPSLEPDHGLLRLLCGLTLIGTLTALAWLFEFAQRESAKAVERALAAAREANRQLLVEQEKLAAARDKAEEENQKKSLFLTRMRENAKAQGLALDDTSAALAEMTETFRTIAESVSTLAEASDECGVAIRQMNLLGEGVRARIQEMVKSVELSVASLEEMGYSVREVAEHIQTLSQVAEDTAASMHEMETSAGQVRENARATERLSENVINDARRGAEAVSRTLDDMENILQLATLAGTTIRRLSGSVQDIDRILEVINEVAEQTQLLSLNAAIIASQAGVHGRGFAVVASEIKKLAERTSTSTKEIAAVIETVQGESKAAVEAIERGEAAVGEGVKRSREAERALSEIVRSAEEATRMVKAIASATVEQADSARRVAESMERVAEAVAQVATATRQQASGAEILLKSTAQMQELASEVERANQEQREGAARVEDAVARIQRMVKQLHQVQADQTRGSEQILHSLEAIGESQRRQVEAIERLGTEETK